MKQPIDQLVSTLDELITSGSGHIHLECTNNMDGLTINHQFTECKPGTSCYTPMVSTIDDASTQ